MATQPKIEFKVLILNEGGTYVAQCLDFDLADQGDTLEEAVENLGHVIFARAALDRAEGRALFEGLPQAPPAYWAKYERGRRLKEPTTFSGPEGLPSTTPPAWMIPALVANDLRVI